MAVTKRLRFEIFRRDNHTCRYCGGSAPDVVLTIDHVTPVALGGSDHPNNLVTACRDCNSGKSSSSATAPLVADVDPRALQMRTVSPPVEGEADSPTPDFQAGWCEAYDRFGYEDIPSRALQRVVDGFGRWGQDLRWEG